MSLQFQITIAFQLWISLMIHCWIVKSMMREITFYWLTGWNLWTTLSGILINHNMYVLILILNPPNSPCFTSKKGEYSICLSYLWNFHIYQETSFSIFYFEQSYDLVTSSCQNDLQILMLLSSLFRILWFSIQKRSFLA